MIEGRRVNGPPSGVFWSFEVLRAGSGGCVSSTAAPKPPMACGREAPFYGLRPQSRRAGITAAQKAHLWRFFICRSVRLCGPLLGFGGSRMSRLPGRVRRVSLLANKPIFGGRAGAPGRQGLPPSGRRADCWMLPDCVLTQLGLYLAHRLWIMMSPCCRSCQHIVRST